MKKGALAEIERALGSFAPEDQEQLGRDVVSYLESMKALRDELAIGERAVAEGNVVTLDEVDAAMEKLRRQYAGR